MTAARSDNHGWLRDPEETAPEQGFGFMMYACWASGCGGPVFRNLNPSSLTFPNKWISITP